jgi:hypothetical protein
MYLEMYGTIRLEGRSRFDSNGKTYFGATRDMIWNAGFRMVKVFDKGDNGFRNADHVRDVISFDLVPDETMDALRRYYDGDLKALNPKWWTHGIDTKGYPVIRVNSKIVNEETGKALSVAGLFTKQSRKVEEVVAKQVAVATTRMKFANDEFVGMVKKMINDTVKKRVRRDMRTFFENLDEDTLKEMLRTKKAKRTGDTTSTAIDVDNDDDDNSVGTLLSDINHEKLIDIFDYVEVPETEKADV